MTAQEVIKNFMATLDNHGYNNNNGDVATKMLDAAIKACSKFEGIDDAISQFLTDQKKAERDAIKEVLESVNKWSDSYDGKQLAEIESQINSLGIEATKLDSNANPSGYVGQASTVSNVIREKAAVKFLEDYCGIVLENDYWILSDGSITYYGNDEGTGNTDTGAITGSDAGTSTTKTAESVVPETGNKYTAATSVGQEINVGSNDWIVKATSAADTITTGGSDSIDSGEGNDKIIVNSDHTTIKTGSGSDEITVNSNVNVVTFNDLNSSDSINLQGAFNIESAKIIDSILTITDSTSGRVIKIANYSSAKTAKINNQTLTDWLFAAGFDINSLQVSTSGYTSEVNRGNLVVNEYLVDDDSKSNTKLLTDSEDEQILPDDTIIRPNTSGLVLETNAAAAYNGTNTVKVNLDEAAAVDSTEGFYVINGNSSTFKITANVASGDVSIGSVSTEFPGIADFTTHGLTVHLKGRANNYDLKNPTALTLTNLKDSERTILSSLYKWWMKEGLKLIEESYNMGFNTDGATVTDIDLYFFTSNEGTLAYVRNYSDYITASKLELGINMKYYGSIAENNVNGQADSTYLDRVLAHEFTHAVMVANINYFNYLPQFIKEGMAELTHGIDDERGSRIFELAGGTSDTTRLSAAVDVTNTDTGTNDCYAGGYMFLRYLAKQGAAQMSGLVSTDKITATVNLADSTNGTYYVSAEAETENASTSITSEYRIKLGVANNKTYTVDEDNKVKQIINTTSSGWKINNVSEGVTVNGNIGADTINAISGTYYIDGGSGADVVNISGGNNFTVKSGIGADTISIAGGSNSSIMSEADNDVIKISGGSNLTIDGGAGNDTIEASTNTLYSNYIIGGAGNDSINVKGNGVTIDGGEGADFIATSQNRNIIIGGSGNDTISLGGSSNVIEYSNGEGNDIIYGYESTTTLHINEGEFTKSHIDGSNLIFTIGNGELTIVGANEKNITIKYPQGNVVTRVYGEEEDISDIEDTIPPDPDQPNPGKIIYGTNVKKLETIVGTEADDTLIGDKSVDVYYGKDGKDVFVYANGGGKDIIYDYTSGEDLISITGAAISKVATVKNTDDLLLTIGKGTISLRGAKGSPVTIIDKDGNKTTRAYGIENITIDDNGGDTINTVIDAAIRNVNASDRTTAVNIVGNTAANSIVGGSGDDSFNGGNGNDTLSGGNGNDTLIGGAGNDYISGDYGNDKLAGDAGNDTLIAGYGDDTLTGGAGNDYISGDYGNDKLVGDAGNDTLVAGYGNDILTGGAGKDTFILSGGSDSISDYVTGQDVINLNSTYIYSAELDTAEKVVKLTMGNSSVVTVKGAVNNKKRATKITVIDYTGNQTARTYGENSLTIANADGSIITATPEVNSMNAASRTKSIYLRGYDLNNSTLKGGRAADTIQGGFKDDILTGGAGNDIFVYSSGNDTISDFTVTLNKDKSVKATDYIQLANGAPTYYHVDGNNVILEFAGNAGTLDNTLTIIKGKDKKISFLNPAGVETIPTSNNSLPSDGIFNDYTELIFTKNQQTTDYAATDSRVKLIDATKNVQTIKITGNDNDNTIKGSASAETIAGGKGNDILTGGNGKDLFIYSSGNDTITDYTAGDTVQVEAVLQSMRLETEGKGKNKDLIFTTSNGTFNLKNAKGKKITFTDVNGNTTSQIYNVAKISVVNTDGATIDANNDLNKSILATIDASKRNKDHSIYIRGNALDKNVLTGGAGNDTIIAYAGDKNVLSGGAGDDLLNAAGGNNNTLTGGAGNDTLIGSSGTDIINQGAGNDLIQLATNHTQATITYTGGNDTVTSFAKTDTLKFAKGITITATEPTEDGKEYTLTFAKGRSTLGTMEVTGTEAFATDTTVKSTTSKKKVTTTTTTYFVTIGGQNAVYNTVVETSTTNSNAFVEHLDEELFADELMTDNMDSILNEKSSDNLLTDYSYDLISDPNNLNKDKKLNPIAYNKK